MCRVGDDTIGGDLLWSESECFGDDNGVDVAVGATVGCAGRTRRDVENCSNAVVRTQ